MKLDGDGHAARGPTIQEIMASNFPEGVDDWEAGLPALAAFHFETEEVVATADVGHILGTNDGFRSCSCNGSCDSSGCQFNVEVDALFSASMMCGGDCQNAEICETDGGADVQQTTTPGEGPDDGAGNTDLGMMRPQDYCTGACVENSMTASEEGYEDEILRLIKLWNGNPWNDPCE